MAIPLALPSNPPAVPWVWRAISSFRFLRGLLPIRERKPSLASAHRGSVSLGVRSFDFEGPDTSLTQAHLEVLK